METMHAAGRRTLPPVPRASPRSDGCRRPTERLSPEPSRPRRRCRPVRTRVGRRPAVRRPAARGGRRLRRGRRRRVRGRPRGGPAGPAPPRPLPGGPALRRRHRGRRDLPRSGRRARLAVPARVRPADPPLARRRASVRDDAWLVADPDASGRRGRRRHRLARRRPDPAATPASAAFAVRVSLRGPDGPRWACRSATASDTGSAESRAAPEDRGPLMSATAGLPLSTGRVAAPGRGA